jgi:predicted membrane-bound spermidine synthase
MDMPLNLIEQEAIAANTRHRTMIWVYVLFFFSGFPALIYQVVWQRALFAIYGVNIESVTMVVGAFMLGLGLGSLLGGFISKRPTVPMIVIFGLVELGTASFGLMSLHLFHFVATFTAGVPALETGLIAFILVVIPTIFMGSTLPLLVAFMVPISRNVGRSVGTLYFLNTMGSTIACFLERKILMRVLGQSGSVNLAAAMNATIGISVLVAFYLFYRQTPSVYQDHAEGEDSGTARISGGLLPFPLAVLIAGAAGFISLSYEIIWYRLYSFASGGEAKSFAYLLGAFLAGIAIGSAVSQRLCRDLSSDKDKTQYIRLIALFVVSANLLGFAVAPVFSFLVHFMVYTHTFPLVMITAAFLGAVFPLICHVSVPPDSRAGSGLSYLYVSNILGSTLGTFIVGFVLMDILSLRQLAVALAVMGLVLGALILMSTRPKRMELSAVLGSTIALAALIGLSSSSLFAGIYERMLPSPEYVRGLPFTHIVETKSGIVTVDASGTIYGGGLYDGRFNTGLIRDTNLILRAYSLSSFHSSPKA